MQMGFLGGISLLRDGAMPQSKHGERCALTLFSQHVPPLTQSAVHQVCSCG